ncbi:MAG TPA: FtsQ-type POTRA domain-containing protein [Longimicrobiales bacterium]
MTRAAFRRCAIATAVVGLVAAAAQAPRLLRYIPAFRVEHVRVMGTRYLAPHEALALSGITRASNVFDDPAPWRAALMAHPLVSDVRIERELPGTLVLTVTEVEPVALARTPVLRAVDGAGRVLPIDLTAFDIDLPVLGGQAEVAPDGRLRDPVAMAMVKAAAWLRTRAPELAARVSEIAPAAGGALRLVLRDPAGSEVLLPGEPGAVRLEQLRLTIADLAAREELDRIRRIDVRYRDQVVVSLTPGIKG